MGGDRHQIGADAGKPRRRLVVADGVEVAAKDRAVHHHPGDGGDDQQHEGRCGDAADAGGEEIEPKSMPRVDSTKIITFGAIASHFASTTRRATRALIDLGHHRIGMITGELWMEAARDR